MKRIDSFFSGGASSSDNAATSEADPPRTENRLQGKEGDTGDSGVNLKD